MISAFRNKGISVGEMSEEETEILIDPEQRLLKKVTVKDTLAAEKLFDNLMGDEPELRRKFIEENSRFANYSL